MTAARSIFLVEDNSTIRQHLIPALEDLSSAKVMATAETEDEAIGWLAGHKGEWEGAVVVLFLREGNGLAVVNWCNGREPHQRVVVLTNYAREDARRRCLDAGADRVFDKSIELDEFFEFCSTDLGA